MRRIAYRELKAPGAWSIASLLAALAAPAPAATLQDVLVATYERNPTLDGQRAELRATDEQAAIARSQGRPQAQIQGSFSQGIDGLRALQGYNRAILAGASVNVPLFQGGRVRDASQAADRRSDAGRAALRATEGDTFVDAVGAYLDVLRDRAILGLNRENVQALQDVLHSSRVRLAEGDVTKTDVSQSVARQQQGQGGLEAAEAQLVASEAGFRRTTGLDAAVLDQPPPLPMMPIDAASAEATALKNNPAIAASQAAIAAARSDVSTARDSRNPTLAFGGSTTYYSYRDRFGGIGNVDADASQVGLTMTLPLYQGGLVSAQIRQAKDRVDQAIDQKQATEEQVVATVRAAYSAYVAAKRTIALSEAAVQANEDALKGVRMEAEAGERQVLDVLNAELELLSSRTALLRAQHDTYVEGFQLLNAMGLVDYRQLGLTGGTLYDPQVNYRHAVRALSDFAAGPRVH